MDGSSLRVADGRVIATDVRWARSPIRRMSGLLGSPKLTGKQALIITKAAQVHSFGMRYSIDVIFCDEHLRVLHIVRALRPFRMTKWVRRARHAIELDTGGAEGVEVGDVLEISAR